MTNKQQMAALIPGQYGLIRVLLGALLSILLIPQVVHAQDKSGVSPQVISLPSGPGSLEGLGETFEPDLSTGTSSYPVKFTAAPGRVGFQPELSLNYNGGNANGPWGMGWKLSVPSIQRRTEDGLPTYDDARDTFIYSSGEKLVRLTNGDYRFENESSFMRFRRIEDMSAPNGTPNNVYWEAHSPDGIRYLFGATDNSRVANVNGTFRWELARVVDTHGNEMRYSYLHDGGYAYPHEVRYNFGQDAKGHSTSSGAADNPSAPSGAADNNVYNAVVFNYEPRPDTYTDRRSGAPIRVGLRGTNIEMWALGKLVRAYNFAYEPERSTGTYSLLTNVTQVGDDGASTLPPHTFTYTQFDPAAHQVVPMQNVPPVVLTNPDADLVDINADGLPDLVHTPEDGHHRFYLNLGHARWATEPIIPDNSPAERLSNPNVRMADMNGDGRVDLLVKASGTGNTPLYYYRNQPGADWEQEDRINFGEAPAFDLNDPNMQLIDVNLDHRIDVVLTVGEHMLIWLAREGAWSTEADFKVPAPAAGDPASFANPKFKVGDMTGDRVDDVVMVREGQVVLWEHNGNGSYETPRPILNPPTNVGEQDIFIRMGDLNNDGQMDLVLPGNRQVVYWLSLGNGSLTDPITIPDTPAFNAEDTAVRLADIDGDGATELVYSSPRGMEYVDFSTGSQPFLLKSIDNGLGRTIHITYKSSIEDYIADQDAGEPWEINLPFPVQVVNRVTVYDANSGDNYTIDYHYRDGFYDGAQKEFRGFVRSQEIEVGDETAATTVTNYLYDVGMTDEAHKGMVLESEIIGVGGHCSGDFNECYQRSVNQLETRVVVDASATSTGKPIAYAFIKQTDAFIHEQTDQPVHLRQAFQQDAYGNQTAEFDFGQVCNGDINSGDVSCGDDEILKYTEYIYDEDRYIFDRPTRVYQTDEHGALVSEVKLYYDGEPFLGLPLGQLTRGDLTRQTENLNPQGDNRFIPTERRKYDQFGNAIGMMDANGTLTTVDYDPIAHTFPVTERLHFADGRMLTYAASYHHGFGKVMGATDYNGHVHAFDYDTFGRITKIAMPGDTLDLPTEQYSYRIGSPRSSITIAKRVVSGKAEVLTSVIYYDGLGRQLQVRKDGENGQVIVEDALTFNARQDEMARYLPYFASSFAYTPPDPSLPHMTYHYDPMSRVVKTVNPDDSTARVVHQPLVELHFDEEDSRADSPHANTPKTLTFDGRKRLVAVAEQNIVNGALETYRTAYVYNELNNLIQVTDARGNIKTARFDALSRMIEIDDPDRGMTRYVYDDVGNLMASTNAMGEVVRYTYDSANRPLTESWQTDTRPETIFTYHYDSDVSPRFPDAQNTMGKIAFVEDPAGRIHYSYDARGNIAGQIRTYTAEDLALVTRMAYDAQDRLTEVVYPDGAVVQYAYNSQNLLEQIPGILKNIDYTAAGQRTDLTYANGVTTSYTHDNRLRLTHLHTRRGPTVLQDLTYGFDQVSNIVTITDGRTDRTPKNDQSQSFGYDNLYRLTSAEGAYGQIDYGYDSLGNMVNKSSTAADARLNMGVLRYGENGAGPHALTSANGQTFDYDANGNRTQHGATTYEWTPRNWLSVATEGSAVSKTSTEGSAVSKTSTEGSAVSKTSTYDYDVDGKRVRQVVRAPDGATTTLYPNKYSEVRGDMLIRYIFGAEQRLARQMVPLDRATLLTGFTDPVSTSANASKTHWYVGDHLGGSSLVLDSNGEVVAETLYYPYGLTRYSHNGDDVHHLYTGKELDATGLYYYGARYYDPTTAQFLSVDPHFAEAIGKDAEDGGFIRLLREPHVANMYAYSLLNPVKYVDPDGHDARKPTIYFEDLARNFPQGEPLEVTKRIGGEVHRGWEINTCSIRVSRSLNYAGWKIPKNRRGLSTWQGADKNHYVRSSRQLASYLKDVFGKPDLRYDADKKNPITQAPQDFQGKKGIIFFRVTQWDDAAGHITLWDGNDCADQCYWDKADYVEFHEIPERADAQNQAQGGGQN